MPANELFTSATKPLLSEVREYFSWRLQGSQDDIEVSHDALGNTVYTSARTENVLGTHHPSLLVASREGMHVVNQNPGLLRAIAEGKLGEAVGEGTEGRVYKIMLNTDAGAKPFALKYTYPIAADEEHPDIFTPGVDQMRFMQLAKKENPLPGLRYAVPLLATQDILLEPFVEHAVTLDQYDKIMYTANPVIRAQVPFTETQQRYIDEMQAYDRTRTPHKKFLPHLQQYLLYAAKGLGSWLETKLPTQFDILAPSISVSEPDNPFNFLISIDEIYRVFRTYRQFAEAGWDVENLQTVARKCCTLVEITVGSLPDSAPVI